MYVFVYESAYVNRQGYMRSLCSVFFLFLHISLSQLAYTFYIYMCLYGQYLRYQEPRGDYD